MQIKLYITDGEIRRTQGAGCIAVPFDSQAEEIIVPPWVGIIGHHAFENFWHARRAVIPEGVTDIDLEAFSYCNVLEELTLPRTLHTIGVRAFYGCHSLTALNLPDGLMRIRGYAFAQCRALKSVIIPHGVRELGMGVFSDCTGLQSVTIPPTVTRMGEVPFENCTSLRHIYARGCTEEVIRQLPAGNTVFLHVDDPHMLPANRRTMARLAYLLDGRDLDDNVGRSTAEFIIKNAAKLVDVVMGEPALLHAMLRARLLPAAGLDLYQQAAREKGDTSLTAALLEYQFTHLPAKDVARARARREQAEERRMMRKLERDLARGDDGSLTGFVFAVAGRLRGYKTHEQVKSFLELHGARLSAAVTPDVDYLLYSRYAEDDHPKRVKAQKLGIPEITERDFALMRRKAEQRGQ